MRFNLLIALLAFCPLASLQAQALPDKKKEKPIKWELGFDVLPLLADTSFHIRESILVKRHVKGGKIRARLGGNFTDRISTPIYEPFNDTTWTNRLRIYVSLGFEKPIYDGSKFAVHWGGDVFFYYGNDKVTRHFDNSATASPPTRLERFQDDFEVRTGGMLFVCGEYAISKKVSLNLEMFWQFLYRHEKDDYLELANGQLLQRGGSTVRRFTTFVQPVSSINLIIKI